MQKLSPALQEVVRFVIGAVLIGIVFLTIYATNQQSLRQSANDPQIQFAEEIANAIQSGVNPAEIVPAGTQQVDMAKALTPFIIIYDADGKAVAGNGALNGSMPTPPKGVFDAASANGQNRVTWQPSQGLRFATVIVSTGGETPTYVLAGRSLREIDARVQQMLLLSAIGYGITVILFGALKAIAFVTRRKESN